MKNPSVKHLGDSAATLFNTTFSLSDRETLRAPACRAEFDNVHIRREAMIARYPSVEELMRGYISVLPQSAQIAAMQPEKQEAIYEELANALYRFQDDDGLVVPKECLLLTAVKRKHHWLSSTSESQ